MAQFSRYYTYIEPVVKSPKSQAYSMMILSLFAIAFFGVFAIRPTILTIISLQKEIEQATIINDKLAQKLKALTAAQDTLNRLGDKKNLLTQALPPTPNLALLLRFLEDAANSSSVKIQNLQMKTIILPGEEARSAQPTAMVLAETTSLDEPAAAGGTATPSSSVATTPESLTEVRFSFSLVGEQQPIQDYLKLLATKRRLIVVDSIRLVLNEKEGGFTCEVTAKAFVKPPGGAK